MGSFSSKKDSQNICILLALLPRLFYAHFPMNLYSSCTISPHTGCSRVFPIVLMFQKFQEFFVAERNALSVLSIFFVFFGTPLEDVTSSYLNSCSSVAGRGFNIYPHHTWYTAQPPPTLPTWIEVTACLLPASTLPFSLA